MRLSKVIPAVAALLVASALPAAAQNNASGDIRTGTLSCHVEPGVGLLITSSRALKCTYNGADGRLDRYTGTITHIGLDLGFTSGADIGWIVLAPSFNEPNGALQGSYAGVSAELTLGAGVGANVLVGGLEKSFALQPISGQTQTGLNIAAAVTGLRLDEDTSMMNSGKAVYTRRHGRRHSIRHHRRHHRVHHHVHHYQAS